MEYVRKAQTMLDEPLKGITPTFIVLGTLATLFIARLLHEILTVGPKKLINKLIVRVMNLAKFVPGVSGAIESEKKKMLDKISNVLPSAEDGEDAVRALPAKGIAAADILARLQKLREKESKKVSAKRLSGCMYMNADEKEHEALLCKAIEMYLHVNTLHGDVFPSGRKFESEIVRMTLDMMHGNTSEHCGVVTSGGTESILMAVKAYRDRAMKKRGITRMEEPLEIVASSTVHAAFDKACHYFGCKLVHVQPDQQTFMVRPQDVKRHITRNTILIVASAPNFPQGTIDPVEELAAIAMQHDIGLHVDSCLGGFVLPFAKELGYASIPNFDFSVKGVTSMSADTHKYGLACKGSSVLMFSSRELRHSMYFIAESWTGGIYGSPTMPGSRPGAPLAATWCAMMHIGKQGYLQQADQIMKCAEEMKQGIQTIPQLQLQGTCPAMVVAFTINPAVANFDIFILSDLMGERGWSLNTLQYPKGVHYAITRNTVGRVKDFVADLKASVQEILDHPEKKGGLAPVYGAAITIPDKSLVGELVCGFIDALIDGPPLKSNK